MSMMQLSDDGAPCYLSYLLRLWRKRDGQGEPIWCASLETPGSHQTTQFKDLPTLFAFLKTQLGSALPAGLAQAEQQQETPRSGGRGSRGDEAEHQRS
jgi:hypothetical protein